MQRAGLFPTYDLLLSFSLLHPMVGFHQILVGKFSTFSIRKEKEGKKIIKRGYVPLLLESLSLENKKKKEKKKKIVDEREFEDNSFVLLISWI